ncbi:MAG: restriction endonuclease subunit S [Coriobacteriia bacterium]|nr:restriction endonuclease subunit S [Coriobacteriia bacterium]
MSRIDELIRELCPNGTPFESIGAVVYRGSTIRWGDVAGEEFQYIDLTSVDRVTHAITETQTISSKDAPSRAQQIVREGDVIFGTTRPMLKRYTAIPAEYDGQIASTGYCVLRPQQERILTNFLFHLLGTAEFYAFVEANQRGASYPGIPDGVVKEFRIPVPPLEVQREIVRVLDLFTTLEAELEAELEARRRQYAHYRDSLLTFPEGGIRWATMGEVGEFIRGRRFTKADVVCAGIPSIHYGEIYTIYGVAACEAVTHVRQDLAAQLRCAKTGDVVIAAVGETVEDVGRAVAWLGEEDVAVHDDCFAYRHLMNPKYVSYYLQTETFHSQKSKYVARAKVKRLSAADLAKITIPIPPLEEQARIVAILDKFDALVNDLSIGLPAELAARRKQYEYYRDRLLTFEEAVA